MHRSTLALAAVAALALTPAAARAATVPVQSLSGDFSASNSTVTKTPDGVHFGTYADGGALGGSLIYTGLNGHKLSELTDFSYTFTYRQAGQTTGAAPYARVFLDSDGDGVVDDDVVLDPSYCATTMPAQSTDLTYQLVGGSVRWDDDGCDGVAPDNQPYASAIAEHGDEPIIGLLVSQGNSTGSDVSALLRRVTVNGTTYAFNAPPADGTAGAPGTNGTAGAPGAPGQNGTTTVITRTVLSTDQPACAGARVRTIHVAVASKGQKLTRVRASLRGERLKTSGRAITVDLTGAREGNYNVKITATYRSAGRSHTVHATRNLSVACS